MCGLLSYRGDRRRAFLQLVREEGGGGGSEIDARRRGRERHTQHRDEAARPVIVMNEVSWDSLRDSWLGWSEKREGSSSSRCCSSLVRRDKSRDVVHSKLFCTKLVAFIQFYSQFGPQTEWGSWDQSSPSISFLILKWTN